MPLRRRWTLVCALSAALSGIGTEIFGLAGFIPPLVGVGGWFALAVDVGPFSRVFGVDLEPPIDIELCTGNDGLDRTFRFAVAAIDTRPGGSPTCSRPRRSNQRDKPRHSPSVCT